MTETTLPAPTPAKDVDALIAYIGPVFIWTMMKHGDNPSYVWHAKNAAGIFALDLALMIVLQVLWIVMPLGMFAIFGLVAWIVRLAVAVASIYALWQTWNGKQAVLPFVSDFGQKIPLEKWFHQSGVSAPAAAAPVAAPAPVEAPVVAPAPTPAPAPMPEPTPTPVVATPAPVIVEMPAPAPVVVVVEAPAPAPSPVPTPMPEPAPAPTPEAPVVAAPTEPTPPAPTV